MVTSDAFALSALLDVDPASGVGDHTAVELRHPTIDLDGDGILDTVVLSDADSLVVATDTDADGIADELTAVDDTGEFASWRFDAGSDGADGWIEVNRGTVGE